MDRSLEILPLNTILSATGGRAVIAWSMSSKLACVSHNASARTRRQYVVVWRHQPGCGAAAMCRAIRHSSSRSMFWAGENTSSGTERRSFWFHGRCGSAISEGCRNQVPVPGTVLWNASHMAQENIDTTILSRMPPG